MSKEKTEFTEKEKASTAYRKKLEEEMTQLRKSLATTQNQASLLQQENADLKKENIRYDERLKGAGLAAFITAFALLFGGAAVTYWADVKYQQASGTGIIAFFLLLVASQAINMVSIKNSIVNFFILVFKKTSKSP